MSANGGGVIVIASVVTVITAEAARLYDRKTLTVKPFIGGLAMAVGLFGVAAVNDEIGRNFAILIMVSALLINGPKLFSLIGGVL